MREGWISSNIAEICEVFTDGNWIESKDQSPNGIRLVQTGNIGEGIFKDRREKARFISEDTFARLKCFEIFENDCLISRLPDPVGRACLIPDTGDRMITAVDCSVLRFKKKVIVAKYFNYFSQSKMYLSDVDAECTGATRKRISRKNLGEISIPLPPLAEQKRIVGVLDGAFGAIGVAVANTQKNLANASELFETTLNNIFTQKGEGWVETTLGEVCELISGQHIDAKDYNIECRGIGYLTGPSDFGYKNPIVSKWTEHPKRTALENDILITVKGSGVGKINLMNIDELAISRQLMAVRATTIETKYLYFFLSQQFAYFQNLANGAAIPGISRTDVLNQKLSVPNIVQQRKMVQRMEACETQTQRLKSIYKQKLDNLAELKQSILQKAFAGELTAGSVIAFPETSTTDALVDTTTPEFAANVLAFGYHRHAVRQKDKTYGRVKGQKCLELTESIGRIDLGRRPIKDAAGPNDSGHMRRAENWAKQQRFFEFVRKPVGHGYDFKKLDRYDEMIAKAFEMTKPHRDQLEKITRLLINKDTEQAEVFVTVRAAWNNLIIDGVKITDEAIIFEARENWHPDKLNINKSKFKTAIQEIKQKNLQPDGSAKYVGKRQERLI